MDGRKNRNFLHIHSTFSVGDSAQSPENIVSRAKELGAENITLTDHRTLLGVDPFMDAGKKYGVNTIPGIENEVMLPEYYAEALSNGHEERKGVLMSMRSHLILVPFDYEGFLAISKATREANTNIAMVNKNPYPRLNDEMLVRYFSGNTHVFATSACIQGPIAAILLNNFRIEERMKKRLDAVSEHKEDYEKYQAAASRERFLKNEVKKINKQITQVSKPLKKPFQQRVARWEEKYNHAEPGSKMYEKAETELKMLRAQISEAKDLASALSSAKIGLQKELSQIEEVMESSKKGYARYEKAKRELSSLMQYLVPEEKLYAEAKKRLMELKQVFSMFYIELQYHGLETEAYVMPILLKMADEAGTPVIAANDAHIPDPTERSIEARRLIRFNYFKKTEEVSEADRQMYIKTDDELINSLSQIIPAERAEEAVDNLRILEKCHVVFPNEHHYPKVKGGATFEEMLEEARQKQIREKKWDDQHEKRLRHEVDVIRSMGYVDYHMVVEHFCRIGRLMGLVPEERRSEIYQHFTDLETWIKNEGFDTGAGIGPGRGSAVGSLVCYLLGITNIDPLKYNLLFERFLNPERVSMPDIDTDIASGIRPILIAYLRWYYGENAICSIVTVTTYGAKAAIQLAGRDRADQLYGKDKEGKKKVYLHEITYALSDMIPSTPGITMNDCEKDVLDKISDNEEMMLIWKRARLIENCVRGTGVHAGGVIISDNDDVNEYVPLAWNNEKNVWVAQCDMVKAEEKGLLKMDLLGLNNLDIENSCIHLIKKHHGICVKLDELPFEKEVFQEIYASGNTNGVFQVESEGMKQMLRDFKPTCFEDIILMVAAYRPGPMQYLPDVIAVKNGKKKVSYKHPLLKPILSMTYGAVIYQEQVMQIFQKLAGYSLGGADLVRRAMSKKKMEKLAKEREAFVHGDDQRNIDGCVKRGVDEQTANLIFDEMMEFAKYAFNKSHAAAYAMVSYQTAWLKFHYPSEYLCALFMHKNQDEFSSVYADCSRYGVRVLPPDINASHFQFVIENGNIRYGFSGIKGIGEANRDLFERICGDRKDRVYDSFQDFIQRICMSDQADSITIPGDVIDILIRAGAFDTFGYSREALEEALEEIKDAKAATKEEFLAVLDSVVIKSTEKDVSFNFANETELLGSILSEHPLDGYLSDEVYNCCQIDKLKEKDGRVSVFGYVVAVQKFRTKKTGAEMVKMRIAGLTGECFILAMERYHRNLEKFQNHVVKVTGKVSDGTVFCDTIRYLSRAPRKYFLDLKTFDCQKKADSITGFHKEMEDGDDAELLIQVHFYKSGHKTETPVAMRRYCTTETLNLLKKIGLDPYLERTREA